MLVQPVAACDTKNSTTVKASTAGVEVKHEASKVDCGKPECKTSGCYDGRHDKK